MNGSGTGTRWRRRESKVERSRVEHLRNALQEEVLEVPWPYRFESTSMIANDAQSEANHSGEAESPNWTGAVGEEGSHKRLGINA